MQIVRYFHLPNLLLTYKEIPICHGMQKIGFLSSIYHIFQMLWKNHCAGKYGKKIYWLAYLKASGRSGIYNLFRDLGP